MTAVAPSKTLYIRNLNERVKLPVLKQDLQTTFSQFGNVITRQRQMQSLWNYGIGRMWFYEEVFRVSEILGREGWLPLLFLLNSNEPGTPNTQLFTIPQEPDTIERYIGMWQRLMCFSIRALSDVTGNRVSSLAFTLT